MVSLLDALRAHKILGIVRGSSPEAAETAALALLEEGVGLIEVSLTTPEAVRVIARLVAAAPAGCLVGAGTVVTDAEAEAVAEAGALFAVSPGITTGIRRAAALGLPVAPGAYTPTEVYAALDLGAEAVKLFPASAGGPAYLKALLQPMPTVSFVPVGGVGLEEARAYLTAGAVAAGVGSPLVGDAASDGDLSALRRRAADFVAVAREFA